MKTYISKLGVSLVALALVVAPALVSAQTAIVATINTPANNAEVIVNQPVVFSGSATGGVPADYGFTWSWGDGSTALGGAQVTKTFTTVGPREVTLAVSDFDRTGTKKITVNVVNATTDSKPVISNVLVASKTQTTATITWTTDIDATSRVIYGLTSQKDPVTGKEIGSAPNYNYTNSEPASVNSSSPKTKSHSVTLTGLTPGTKYYFRVLSAK